MAWLGGVFVDRAATRDALVRRKFGRAFDSANQQIERLLRMGFDKLELRECLLECFDVVAILHLVETVGWSFLVDIVPRCCSHTACVRPSIGVNRQQRVHRTRYGDKRPTNAAGSAKICYIFSDVGERHSVDINITAEPCTISIVRWVQSLLPLAHRDFPEPEIIEPPQRGWCPSLASCEVRRIASGKDVLRCGAAGVKLGSDIIRIVQDCWRQSA